MLSCIRGGGGQAVGTFESNVLSAIAPLGHATKTWAVIGIPVGYNIINVGSFLVMSIDQSSVALQVRRACTAIYIPVCARPHLLAHFRMRPRRRSSRSTWRS